MLLESIADNQVGKSMGEDCTVTRPWPLPPQSKTSILWFVRALDQENLWYVSFGLIDFLHAVAVLGYTRSN